MTEIVHHEQKAPRLGILPITMFTLERMLHLQDGYHIVSVHYNEYRRALSLTLASDALPEVQEYCELPQLCLQVTVSSHPDAPIEYCKITTEVKLI